MKKPQEEPKQDRTCTNSCSVVCGECQIFEPKQETLEEVATKEGLFRASQHNFNQAEAGYNAKWFKRGALFGAKWQQEQDKKMYSEDEVYNILEQAMKDAPIEGLIHHYDGDFRDLKEWFEQFKK